MFLPWLGCLAINEKNFFSPLSSAQYDIRCKGNWCSMTCVLGSCMATPSALIVSSTLRVLAPVSLFLSCCENFSFRIPSLTTSIPKKQMNKDGKYV